jgi:hypothetical protein
MIKEYWVVMAVSSSGEVSIPYAVFTQQDKALRYTLTAQRQVPPGWVLVSCRNPVVMNPK